MTRFSILVACYNAAPYIRQTLDSLLSQTLSDIEVICIDDCSTDNTLQILDEYAGKDRRVKMLKTSENSGQAVARNLGLKHATGVLTTMVDADDWLAPDALEKMWQTFSTREDIDSLAFRLQMVEERGITHPFKEDETIPPLMTGEEACLLAINWRLHGFAAVRTELHRRYPYDETTRVYSDDNTSRIHYLKSRFVAQTDADYFYRQHPASVTHQRDTKRLDFLRANDSLRTSLEKEGANAAILQTCEEYCWRIFLGICKDMLHQRRQMTDAEWKDTDSRLREAYNNMHTDRLAPTLRRSLRTGPLTCYACFMLREKFIARLKGCSIN